MDLVFGERPPLMVILPSLYFGAFGVAALVVVSEWASLLAVSAKRVGLSAATACLALALPYCGAWSQQSANPLVFLEMMAYLTAPLTAGPLRPTACVAQQLQASG